MSSSALGSAVTPHSVGTMQMDCCPLSYLRQMTRGFDTYLNLLDALLHFQSVYMDPRWPQKLLRQLLLILLLFKVVPDVSRVLVGLRAAVLAVIYLRVFKRGAYVWSSLPLLWMASDGSDLFHSIQKVQVIHAASPSDPWIQMGHSVFWQHQPGCEVEFFVRAHIRGRSSRDFKIATFKTPKPA